MVIYRPAESKSFLGQKINVLFLNASVYLFSVDATYGTVVMYFLSFINNYILFFFELKSVVEVESSIPVGFSGTKRSPVMSVVATVGIQCCPSVGTSIQIQICTCWNIRSKVASVLSSHVYTRTLQLKKYTLISRQNHLQLLISWLSQLVGFYLVLKYYLMVCECNQAVHQQWEVQMVWKFLNQTRNHPDDDFDFRIIFLHVQL